MLVLAPSALLMTAVILLLALVVRSPDGDRTEVQAGGDTPERSAADFAGLTTPVSTEPVRSVTESGESGRSDPAEPTSEPSPPPVSESTPAAPDPGESAPPAATTPTQEPPVVATPPPSTPQTQPQPGESCTRRSASINDYKGRHWSVRYDCRTYVGSAVYANVSADASGSLDDSGYMNQASVVWVICQLQGRANPVFQGNTNTWWLYTQGDASRSNGYGYTKAWGYLPATAVAQGGQNEPVPGVPACSGYL